MAGQSIEGEEGGLQPPASYVYVVLLKDLIAIYCYVIVLSQIQQIYIQV